MARPAVESPLNPSKKRGPGRPKTVHQPNAKQLKRESDALLTPQDASESETPETRSLRLPTKISDSYPLPVLPEPQSLALSDAEYASIASSAVLANSLERSRISWTYAGIFDRYWTKPETGKAARPPPPNNPDPKTMKSRGRCRLRIEPHIFEVEIYVVDRPWPQPPRSSNTSKTQNQGHQQWYNAQQHNTAFGSPSVSPYGSPHLGSGPPQKPQQKRTSNVGGHAGDKKSVTDPVIGMLAQRAGSDPELKALMREVAAGQATPEQVKIFQWHIDELTTLLQAQSAKEGNTHKAATPQASQSSNHPASRQHTPNTFTAPAPQPNLYTQPSAYVPPAPPPPSEVAFAFTTPGSCADRFLFPRHAILETLTPQHMLASFLVTRSGRDAVDPDAFDRNKTFFFPVTIMVEVAYGREGILGDIKRWVASPDEARKHMKNTMDLHERLQDSYLALRLPLKSATDSTSHANSHAGTPVPTTAEDKEKKKRDSKRNMPATMYKKRGLVTDEPPADPGTVTQIEEDSKQTTVPPGNKEAPTTEAKGDGASKKVDDSVESEKTEQPANDNRRSTRATRKSSRLTE